MLRANTRCETLGRHRLSYGVRAMNKSATGFDYDRYRKLLTEATDEPKRLALIKILIDEKAKDRLAGQSLHAGLAELGLKATPRIDLKPIADLKLKTDLKPKPDLPPRDVLALGSLTLGSDFLRKRIA
jgi:hypothetical protein